MADGGTTGIGGNVSQSVIVTGDHNTVSLSFGDSNIVLGLVCKHVRPLDRRRSLRPGEPPRELDLLDPELGTMPIIGRNDMLEQLRAWAESDEDVSLHAVIGPAGSGKTRLALALCEALDPGPSFGPWRAGFLSGSNLRSVVEALPTRRFDWAGKPMLLIVLDNAAQCHQAMARWLDRLAFEHLGEARLRILLLEREAPENFGWWHDLTNCPDRRNLFHVLRPMSLTTLTDLEERRAIMVAAYKAGHECRMWAPVFGAIPLAGQSPAIDLELGKPQFGNPLNLVMAGILAVDQGATAALALRRLDAALRLGNRELQRFAGFATASGVNADAMRHAIGLDAAQEAVDLYRGLAAGRADAFTPYLAMSLATLGNAMSSLGQWGAALPPAQEAVDLYRVLAGVHLDAFATDLAGSLVNLAVVLDKNKQQKAALSAAREATDLYRPFVNARPDTFKSDFVKSLSVLRDLLKRYE